MLTFITIIIGVVFLLIYAFLLWLFSLFLNIYLAIIITSILMSIIMMSYMYYQMVNKLTKSVIHNYCEIRSLNIDHIQALEIITENRFRYHPEISIEVLRFLKYYFKYINVFEDLYNYCLLIHFFNERKEIPYKIKEKLYISFCKYYEKYQNKYDFLN